MKNEERDERKSRKILVPLATLAIASAVAVGSGATFTSTSQIHASVTAGKIVMDNLDHENGTLSVVQLKPGDEDTGTVTLTEGPGSDLNGDLTVVVDNVKSQFATDAVSITVSGNGKTDSVDLESLVGGSDTIDLGSLTAGWGTTDIDVTVSMAGGAGNENQGKLGKADLTFVLTATDGSDHETTATWS